MVCKIDYVNPVLGGELMQIVEKWYESLPKKSGDNWILTFFNKHYLKFRIFVQLIIIIGGFVLLYPIINRIGLSTEPPNLTSSIFFIISSCFLAYAFFGFLGKYYSDKLKDMIDKIDGLNLVELTKGDINLNIEKKEKNNSMLKQIILRLIVTVIASSSLYFVGKLLIIVVEFMKKQ